MHVKDARIIETAQNMSRLTFVHIKITCTDTNDFVQVMFNKAPPLKDFSYDYAQKTLTQKRTPVGLDAIEGVLSKTNLGRAEGMGMATAARAILRRSALAESQSQVVDRLVDGRASDGRLLVGAELENILADDG
jgi:hypothetical protein